MGCIAHVTINNLHDLLGQRTLIFSHVPLLPLMTYVNGEPCMHDVRIVILDHTYICIDYQHDMCVQPSMGTVPRSSVQGLVVSTRKLGNFHEDPRCINSVISISA